LSIINTVNGIIVTTKLQEIEEENDDDDQNNAGFEKLSEEGHQIGLFILKIRQQLIRIIEKKKVRICSFVPFSLILNLNRL